MSLLAKLKVPHSQQTVSNVWINDDIRPLPPHRRQWDRLAYISFWAINQICLSNWQLGSSLVAIGLSVWQAMIAVIIGKVIVALVAVFNGYVGAEWHIGFPIVSRYLWGMYGQYIALVQRIVLSLVWFSVQRYVHYHLGIDTVLTILQLDWRPLCPGHSRQHLLWLPAHAESLP